MIYIQEKASLYKKMDKSTTKMIRFKEIFIIVSLPYGKRVNFNMKCTIVRVTVNLQSH